MKLDIPHPEHETTVRAMADMLHENCCTQDHATTCGWYYEEGWEDKAHIMWRSKAIRFMQDMRARFEVKQ